MIYYFKKKSLQLLIKSKSSSESETAETATLITTCMLDIFENLLTSSNDEPIQSDILDKMCQLLTVQLAKDSKLLPVSILERSLIMSLTAVSNITDNDICEKLTIDSTVWIDLRCVLQLIASLINIINNDIIITNISLINNLLNNIKNISIFINKLSNIIIYTNNNDIGIVYMMISIYKMLEMILNNIPICDEINAAFQSDEENNITMSPVGHYIQAVISLVQLQNGFSSDETVFCKDSSVSNLTFSIVESAIKTVKRLIFDIKICTKIIIFCNENSTCKDKSVNHFLLSVTLSHIEDEIIKPKSNIIIKIISNNMVNHILKLCNRLYDDPWGLKCEKLTKIVGWDNSWLSFKLIRIICSITSNAKELIQLTNEYCHPIIHQLALFNLQKSSALCRECSQKWINNKIIPTIIRSMFLLSPIEFKDVFISDFKATYAIFKSAQEYKNDATDVQLLDLPSPSSPGGWGDITGGISFFSFMLFHEKTNRLTAIKSSEYLLGDIFITHGLVDLLLSILNFSKKNDEIYKLSINLLIDLLKQTRYGVIFIVHFYCDKSLSLVGGKDTPRGDPQLLALFCDCLLANELLDKSPEFQSMSLKVAIKAFLSDLNEDIDNDGFTDHLSDDDGYTKTQPTIVSSLRRLLDISFRQFHLLLISPKISKIRQKNCNIESQIRLYRLFIEGCKSVSLLDQSDIRSNSQIANDVVKILTSLIFESEKLVGIEEEFLCCAINALSVILDTLPENIDRCKSYILNLGGAISPNETQDEQIKLIIDYSLSEWLSNSSILNKTSDLLKIMQVM
eukprot:GHVL01009060.1.p1 GENE.GHVL01009060.1~~GHVL01009060.1.p1  ORF type:complete len:795 (+),score=206.76 GHVL01009060.1:635-3019(+)